MERPHVPEVYYSGGSSGDPSGSAKAPSEAPRYSYWPDEEHDPPIVLKVLNMVCNIRISVFHLAQANWWDDTTRMVCRLMFLLLRFIIDPCINLFIEFVAFFIWVTKKVYFSWYLLVTLLKGNY